MFYKAYRKCFKTCEETVNHVSECNKLAQKEYNSRHDWVGEVIHWELFKSLKFGHEDQWYEHH